MRNLNIIFLAILLIFLAGCTKKPDKTVLTFTSWGSKSEIAILKPLIEEFEEQNSDISIEFIHTPENYFRKLHLLVASNLTPDVVFINNIYGALYAESGVFLDLSEFMKKDEISEQDFYQVSLDTFRREGKLYAIPRDVSNLVIYYNKDIFDQYGVPYPQEDWTYEDFLKTAKQLTQDVNGDGRTDIFGISFQEALLFWLPYLMSDGGGVLSPDTKDIIIGKPASIEAIQFYSDLRNRYHVAPTKSEAGSATMAQFFMQGRLAMHLDGRWFVPIYRKEIDFNWDVASFPRGKAGSITACDASGWAISAKTKHPEEAWRFVSFLASKTSIEKFTKSGLIVPARVDVANSPVFLDKSQPPEHPEVFITTMERSVPTPVTKNYQEITDILQNALEPVWSGRLSARQAVDEKLVDRLQKTLE